MLTKYLYTLEVASCWGFEIGRRYRPQVIQLCVALLPHYYCPDSHFCYKEFSVDPVSKRAYWLCADKFCMRFVSVKDYSAREEISTDIKIPSRPS